LPEHYLNKTSSDYASMHRMDPEWLPGDNKNNILDCKGIQELA
jgi:hypothetical protein